MDYRESYRILNIGLAVGTALLLFASMTEVLWIGIVGIVVALAGMIQAFIFCKCPHCGARFNLRAKLPKFCPECGKELENW